MEADKKERIEGYIKAYQELLEEKGYAAGKDAKAIKEKLNGILRAAFEGAVARTKGSDKVITFEVVAGANIGSNAAPDQVVFRIGFEYDPVPVAVRLKAVVLDAGELKIVHLPEAGAALKTVSELVEALLQQRLELQKAMEAMKHPSKPKKKPPRGYRL